MKKWSFNRLKSMACTVILAANRVVAGNKLLLRFLFSSGPFLFFKSILGVLVT